MTALDALTAAGKIWGQARVSLARRTAAGWDIHLLPSRAGQSLASDCRDRWLVVHTLDETGRPTCHDDCRALAGVA